MSFQRTQSCLFYQLVSFFLQIEEKGYRRLTPIQNVGLRHAGYALEVTDIEKASNGEVINLICKCTEVEKVSVKPKAFIHWVSQPQEIEVRLYSPL